VSIAVANNRGHPCSNRARNRILLETGTGFSQVQRECRQELRKKDRPQLFLRQVYGKLGRVLRGLMVSMPRKQCKNFCAVQRSFVSKSWITE